MRNNIIYWPIADPQIDLICFACYSQSGCRKILEPPWSILGIEPLGGPKTLDSAPKCGLTRTITHHFQPLPSSWMHAYGYDLNPVTNVQLLAYYFTFWATCRDKSWKWFFSNILGTLIIWDSIDNGERGPVPHCMPSCVDKEHPHVVRTFCVKH